MAGQQQPPGQAAHHQAQGPKRPLGVTILGVLHLLGGLFSFLAALFVFSAWFSVVEEPYYGDPEADILLIIAVFLLLLSIANLVLARGLFRLRTWARKVAWALALFSVLFGIFTLLQDNYEYVLNMIISLVIMFYLSSRSVKEAFRERPYIANRPPPD